MTAIEKGIQTSDRPLAIADEGGTIDMMARYETTVARIVAALEVATEHGCLIALSKSSIQRSDVTFVRRTITADDIFPGRIFHIESSEWTVEFPPTREMIVEEQTLYYFHSFGGPLIILSQYIKEGSDRKHGDIFLRNKSEMDTSPLLVPAPEKAIAIFKDMRRILRRKVDRAVS